MCVCVGVLAFFYLVRALDDKGWKEQKN
jgi:hypothetical protein